MHWRVWKGVPCWPRVTPLRFLKGHPQKSRRPGAARPRRMSLAREDGAGEDGAPRVPAGRTRTWATQGHSERVARGRGSGALGKKKQ